MNMRIIFFALALVSIINCQAQSLDIPELQALKEKIADDTYPNIDGIIVEQCDNIIIEEYFNDFNKNSRHDMRSSFKSVTSILAGIAVDQKLISIDDKIIKY